MRCSSHYDLHFLRQPFSRYSNKRLVVTSNCLMVQICYVLIMSETRETAVSLTCVSLPMVISSRTHQLPEAESLLIF